MLRLLLCLALVQTELVNSVMYVPAKTLRKADLCSILRIALPAKLDSRMKQRVDYHHSRRTMLRFLLSIRATGQHERLEALIKQCEPAFQWSKVESDYQALNQMIEPYQEQNAAGKYGSYWEMKVPAPQSGAAKSRQYIARFRSEGFQPAELKIYWNYDQIRALRKCGGYNPVTDTDAKRALSECPVSERSNGGRIKFVTEGIEQAVFDVPAGKQVIVLDFADERMPGGYFLEGARSQEEVILYNSDGYQALLDLKYKMMDGGYMLPEFGVAYVKRVRFFQGTSKQPRLADLIVAACYDLSSSGEGLHKPPSRDDTEDIRARTFQKVQAIIASAVANTEGDGSRTYLLLGPIGTGAFQNDVKLIANVFRDVLTKPLMDSQEAVQYAFEEIWFVSIGSLKVFKDVFKGTF